MIKLTDRISYILSCDSPLSSDVAIIKGDNRTYIYDVGNGSGYVDEINDISGDKVIILSHFHPDHMRNLSMIPSIPCYVGSNTFKYTKRGEIVNTDVYIDDGVQLHIFPVPSSHAKGSLGLEVDDEYAFVGDAIGPAIKPDKLVYNVQMLFEEIRTLKRLKASKIIQSHRMNKIEDKYVIIEKLETIYAKRNGKEPYIEIEE